MPYSHCQRIVGTHSGLYAAVLWYGIGHNISNSIQSSYNQSSGIYYDCNWNCSTLSARIRTQLMDNRIRCNPPDMGNMVLYPI